MSVVRKIESLSAKSLEWKDLSLPEKAEILRQCLNNIENDSSEMNAKTYSQTLSKIYKMETGANGKDNAAMHVYNFFAAATKRLECLLRTIDAKATYDSIKYSSMKDSFSQATITSVYPLPSETKDVFASIGVTVDVWSDKTKSKPNSILAKNSGVTVVLGSGTSDVRCLLDALERLFVHNEVVILKLHPIRSHLYDMFRKLMSHMIQKDYFAVIMDDGNDSTRDLIYHPLTRHLHLTGDSAAHNSILTECSSGTSSTEKSSGLKASLSCELGGVTPWIVVPDYIRANADQPRVCWTEANLNEQAKHLVSRVQELETASGMTPQVLVLAREWEHKQKFLDYVRKAVIEIPSSAPYYEGHKERFERFVMEYGEDAEILKTPILDGKGTYNFALLHVKMGPGNKGGKHYALQHDALTPVLSIVELDLVHRSKSGAITSITKTNIAERLLSVASGFCNNNIHGSLSCTIICPPTVPHDTLDKAVSELQYGQIAINIWTAVGFNAPHATWGTYPGLYKPKAPGSGCGVIGNTALFPDYQILKSVVRAPWINALQMKGDLVSSFMYELLTIITRKRTTVGRLLGIAGLLISRLKFW